MKTVLLAAAGSLFLAFAAHAADAPQPEAGAPPVSQALPPVSASGAACIDGATVTSTAYSTDEDAENETGTCSSYLSTQSLVQPPATGRT